VVSRVNPESIGLNLKDPSSSRTSLKPLHQLLQSLMNHESTFSDAVGQAASAAIDAGIEVLYPTAIDRYGLLSELVQGGATLEAQFRWPTHCEV
jgi:hypothetical protein